MLTFILNQINLVLFHCIYLNINLLLFMILNLLIVDLIIYYYDKPIISNYIILLNFY
jgi:hypothetical protein